MMQLELPHVSVMTKMDLVNREIKELEQQQKAVRESAGDDGLDHAHTLEERVEKTAAQETAKEGVAQEEMNTEGVGGGIMGHEVDERAGLEREAAETAKQAKEEANTAKTVQRSTNWN